MKTVRLPAALLLALASAGCNSARPSKPLAQLSPEEQVGHAAFQQNCGACHYDRETGSLHGPSLQGVYQKPYLPSGAPANDDRIRNVIQHGRGNMPAFGDSISPDTVEAILAYLKTL